VRFQVKTWATSHSHPAHVDGDDQDTQQTADTSSNSGSKGKERGTDVQEVILDYDNSTFLR